MKKSKLYPEDVIEHTTKIAEQKQQKKYILELETALGSQALLTDEIKKIVTDYFEKNPIKLSKSSPKPKIVKTPNEMLAFVSDTHFGLDISPEEVENNHYNWLIACRRMAKFTEQIVQLNKESKDEASTLKLIFGGDLGQGIIHLAEEGTHLLTTQIHGISQILIQMIDYLHEHFSKIDVVCVSCNHMRMVHKDTGRATAQKSDSYATIIHTGLETAFRHVPEVTFTIPMTPYAIFESMGHTFMVTHGDTYLEPGNIGTAVDTKRLTNQVNAINVERYSSGQKPIEVVLMGHVHTPMSMTLNSGVELVINGTASGTDPYAQSIGITGNHPCQVVFKATAGSPVADFNKVFLLDAGTEARYDQIIKNNTKFLSPLNR